MQVIIDNIDSLVEPDTERTLGEFLKNLSQWIAENNRTPVRIVVDGRQFGAESSKELLDTDIHSVKILEITTVDKNEKIVEILHGIYEQVPLLVLRLSEAAGQLRAGKSDAGLKVFSEAVDTWHLLNEALMKVCADLGFDFKALVVVEGTATVSATELITQLTDFVNACNESLKNHDSVAVADTIEYELIHRIRHYTSIVQSLSRNAREKIANA